MNATLSQVYSLAKWDKNGEERATLPPCSGVPSRSDSLAWPHVVIWH
jgi:hypothetical protein